jgi:hypothetical protein
MNSHHMDRTFVVIGEMSVSMCRRCAKPDGQIAQGRVIFSCLAIGGSSPKSIVGNLNLLGHRIKTADAKSRKRGREPFLRLRRADATFVGGGPPGKGDAKFF